MRSLWVSIWSSIRGNREEVLFEKNIKVFDRRQLVQFLRVIRERGVPVKIDQVSAHFLGLPHEGDAFEKDLKHSYSILHIENEHKRGLHQMWSSASDRDGCIDIE